LGSIDDDKDQARRREPTEEERAAFEEMLLGHDIEGARLRAMSYAMKLTRDNQTMSRQMADEALSICWERCLWDPERVTLGRYLVGIVRSQWSTAARDGATEREHEELYLAEMEALDGAAGASPEDAILDHAEHQESQADALHLLTAMRTHFEKNGDTVSLQRMDFMADEIDSPAEMARLSGRPVEDFYRAAERCARLVRKLRARDKE
jgi:hypothetical protein